MASSLDSGAFVAVNLAVVALAVTIDLAAGEFYGRLHPTVLMGKFIATLESMLKSKDLAVERRNGILLGISSIIIFTSPVYVILFTISYYIGVNLLYIAVSSLLFKFTFAIKAMRNHAVPVVNALTNDNLIAARKFVSHIVGRKTENSDEKLVISACVESIGEGTVDGVTSPLFYFALFGVPGAVAYRVVNTLDSMVGYRDQTHINIGWFSARMDTVANFIPARFTGFLMVAAAWFLRENWKVAWQTLRSDRYNTPSLNGGWPMSAMAGALNVRLEKPGFYALGNGEETLSSRHIYRALRIMYVTVFLFTVIVVLPLVGLMSILLG